jgi:hypothetical protein
MQFRIYSIKSAVNVELLNRDEEWLETSVRDRLVLENRTMEERPIETIEEMEKSVQVDDDQMQLPTPFESPSPQIIPLRFEKMVEFRVFIQKTLKMQLNRQM